MIVLNTILEMQCGLVNNAHKSSEAQAGLRQQSISEPYPKLGADSEAYKEADAQEGQNLTIRDA